MLPHSMRHQLRYFVKDSAVWLASVLSVVFACGGCSPRVDLEAERQALLETDAACATAASADDMERLWTFWSKEAILLMSADWRLEGHEEIKQFTIRAREDPDFSISWAASGAGVSPDAQMGYTYGAGTITRTGDDGQITTNTRPYLTVWRKQPDGSWKSVIEN